MNSLRFKAVLFDLGDTLIHFRTYRTGPYLREGAVLAHRRLVDEGFRPPPFGAYYRRVRRAFLWAYLKSRMMYGEVKIAETLRRAHRSMRIELPADRTMELLTACEPAIRLLYERDESAIPTLEVLRQRGVAMGVVSNTFFPGHAVDGVLRDLGLLDYFPIRSYSSEVGRRKPHRAIFEDALQRMGIVAHGALYVGDHARKDVGGAARVGMTPVLMTKTGRFSRRRRGAAYVIHELTELLPICFEDGPS